MSISVHFLAFTLTSQHFGMGHGLCRGGTSKQATRTCVSCHSDSKDIIREQAYSLLNT